MSNSKDIDMVEVKVDGYFYSIDNSIMKDFSSIFTKFLEENRLEFIGITKEVIKESSDKAATTGKDMKIIWDKIMAEMDFYLPRISLDTWIKPLIPYSLKDNNLVLIAPNNFTKELLIKSYLRLMKSSLKELDGIDYNIEFIVKEADEIEYNKKLTRNLDYISKEIDK